MGASDATHGPRGPPGVEGSATSASLPPSRGSLDVAGREGGGTLGLGGAQASAKASRPRLLSPNSARAISTNRGPHASEESRATKLRATQSRLCNRLQGAAAQNLSLPLSRSRRMRLSSVGLARRFLATLRIAGATRRRAGDWLLRSSVTRSAPLRDERAGLIEQLCRLGCGRGSGGHGIE
ncbi:unnamed protein product [Lampetra fluviatilis]